MARECPKRRGGLGARGAIPWAGSASTDTCALSGGGGGGGDGDREGTAVAAAGTAKGVVGSNWSLL